jgi:hypothetical protein
MNLRLVDVVILPDGRMDRKNAALYLGLKVKTLAMHASRGTGPAFIKRGRVFYFRDDLDDWVSGGAQAARPHRRRVATGDPCTPGVPSQRRRQNA